MTDSIRTAADAVRELGSLPMPVGPDPQPTPARLSPQREAEIAARVEAATKGPWGFYDGDTYADVAADLQMTSRASYSYRQKIAQLEDENYWDDPAHEDHDEQRAPEQMGANAEFIAHAREDVPALLAELAAVRAERDEARRMLNATARLAGRLENRVNRAAAERDEAKTTLREACEQVAERDHEIGGLHAEVARLKAELATKRDEIADDIHRAELPVFAETENPVLVAKTVRAIDWRLAARGSAAPYWVARTEAGR
ncbi:hypothetical protein [Streptomyces venezuelae]|uniref:Uncharacterized protein n=1 Tax=Streptomyces venezuelae TaxID=54571 RepID=A0A5P2B640_STRVZ|nr:hypothetical protein [Streptomyces venezuelae]QES25904.1 hypothetical protein DEJ47_05025 [Streptomyces venezuelae]